MLLPHYPDQCCQLASWVARFGNSGNFLKALASNFFIWQLFKNWQLFWQLLTERKYCIKNAIIIGKISKKVIIKIFCAPRGIFFNLHYKLLQRWLTVSLDTNFASLPKQYSWYLIWSWLFPNSLHKFLNKLFYQALLVAPRALANEMKLDNKVGLTGDFCYSISSWWLSEGQTLPKL